MDPQKGCSRCDQVVRIGLFFWRNEFIPGMEGKHDEFFPSGNPV
jgi:hypothetical protein